MLLELYLRSMRLSNNSATSGFIWEEFDFELCKDFISSKYIWAACTMLCFVLGFPASIVILWEMFKTHRRGNPFTPNNFFILNLTIMDVVFLVSIPPGTFNNLIWKSWPLEACWNALYALNMCGRPLMMACICLDCYLAVVHPITYHKRKSLVPRVLMAGTVWTLTLSSSIVYFLFHKMFSTFFAIVPSITAIVIIGICDSFILHALMKSDPGRKDIHPQKQRAIQTLINSLVITLFSYLPPVLLMVVGKSLISNPTAFICVIIVPMNISSSSGSAIIPILHLHNNGKFNCFRLRCYKKF